jgi:hypothetical protein
MECGRVGKFKDSHFANHLYGVFTAAKDRLVNTGRKKSAASYVPTSVGAGTRKNKARKKRPKKRRSRKKKGQFDVSEAVPNVGLDELSVRSSVFLETMCERQHAGVLDHTCGKRSYRAHKRITADGDLTSHADGRNVVEEQKQGDDVSAYGATVTDWQVQRRDLEVGGT